MAPFITHIPTSPVAVLRQKMSPFHVRADNGPFGGNVADDRRLNNRVPFMNQMPRLPWLSIQRMSAFAVAVEVTGAGNRPDGRDEPKLLACTMLVPFISHMPTLPLVSRQRMSALPSPLKSRWPTSDQLRCHSVDARWPCRDCRTVHQPHADIAGDCRAKECRSCRRH